MIKCRVLSHLSKFSLKQKLATSEGFVIERRGNKGNILQSKSSRAFFRVWSSSNLSLPQCPWPQISNTDQTNKS